jgi:hypothetical protein
MSSLGPGVVLVIYKRRQGHTQNEDTDGESATRKGNA